MNQQPPIDLSIFFAMLAGIIVVALVILVLVIYFFLYKPASEIPEQYRHTSPGSAFLLLIPLFGLVWIFLFTQKLSRSFQDWLNTGDDCGEQLGMWWGACVIGSIIPFIGTFVGIAGLVLMIMYLVKVNEALNRGRRLGAGSHSHGGEFDQDFDDPQNRYSR